jgi:hypothetical protein
MGEYRSMILLMRIVKFMFLVVNRVAKILLKMITSMYISSILHSDHINKDKQIHLSKLLLMSSTRVKKMMTMRRMRY